MRVLLLVIALVRTWANTRTIPVSFWPSCCCERHALHRALLRLRACFGVVADAMTEVDWQTETLISESSKRIFNQTLCPHSSCLPFHPTGDFGVRWAGVMSAPSRSVLREVALGNSRTCQQVPNPGVTHTHTPTTHGTGKPPSSHTYRAILCGGIRLLKRTAITIGTDASATASTARLLQQREEQQ